MRTALHWHTALHCIDIQHQTTIHCTALTYCTTLHWHTALHYTALTYSSTLHYYTALRWYSALHCIDIQHYTALHCTASTYSTTLHCTVLHWHTALHYTVQTYSTAEHCTVLTYCTDIQRCSALHCTDIQHCVALTYYTVYCPTGVNWSYGFRFGLFKSVRTHLLGGVFQVTPKSSPFLFNLLYDTICCKESDILKYSHVLYFLLLNIIRRELSDHAGSRMPGYIVLLSQILHLIVMGDFFYYYFKSLSKGVPMQLPATNYSTSVWEK